MERIINFLKYRKIAIGASLVLLIIFLSVTYLSNGFNWGIDFIGGVKTTIKFEKGIGFTEIREALGKNNISAVIQQIGDEEDNEYIIGTRLMGEGETSEQTLEKVKAALSGFKNVNILSDETVGPAMGDYLKESALYSVMIAFVLILLYLTFRFEFKYSVGAIMALVHDVLLASLFCGFMRIEVDIPVVVAILTLAGYSVNDTIVIFDRIRENVNVKSKQTYFEIINKSISQTLSRTLLTSLTTMFVVVVIFLIGGETLKNFSLVLIFGLIIGTYSTIYIASPVVLLWEKITSK